MHISAKNWRRRLSFIFISGDKSIVEGVLYSVRKQHYLMTSYAKETKLRRILKRICIIYTSGFPLVLEKLINFMFQSGKSEGILVSHE